jgi:hypothetical protein
MAYQSPVERFVAFKHRQARARRCRAARGFVLRTAGGPGGKISKNAYGSERGAARPDAPARSARSAQDVRQLQLRALARQLRLVLRGVFPRHLGERAGRHGGDREVLTSITTTTTTIVAIRLARGSPRLPRRRRGGADRSFDRRQQLAQSAHHWPDRDRHDGCPVDGGTLTLNAVADTAFTITRPGQKLINPAAGSAVVLLHDRGIRRRSRHDRDLLGLHHHVAQVLDGDERHFDVRHLLGRHRPVHDGIRGLGSDLHVADRVTGTPALLLDAVVRYSSTDFVELTSWDLTIDIGGVAPEVVGSIISPDVFTGQMGVSMNFTMLRPDYLKMTDFLAETALTFQAWWHAGERVGTEGLPLAVRSRTSRSAASTSRRSRREAGPRTQTISVPADLVGKDTTGGAFDATMVKLQVSNT